MIAAVPADQPVLSDQPDVSGPRYRLRRRLGDLFFRRGRSLCRRFGVGQELGQFLLGEAQQIEPPIGGLKFPEFRRQRIFVPPGVLTDPVVREDVRTLLRLAEVIEHDHRHVLQPQLPRGQQPAVAGDDPGVGVHQDRIVEPELHDARRNLGNLLVGMRPCIPGVWHQPLDGPQFDLPRHGGRDTRFSHECCPPSEFGGRSTASLAPPSNFQSPGTADRRRLASRDMGSTCNRPASPATARTHAGLIA